MSDQDELDDDRVRAALGRLLAEGDPYTALPLVNPLTNLFPTGTIGALDTLYKTPTDTLTTTVNEIGTDLEALTDLTTEGRLSEDQLSAAYGAPAILDPESPVGAALNSTFLSYGMFLGTADLDAITTAGMYIQNSNSNITDDGSSQHYPMAVFPTDANKHGILQVFTSANGGIVQEWRPAGSTANPQHSTFRRDKKSGANSWTPWEKVARPLASAPTPGTAVLRDASGRTQFAAPAAADDAATKDYVDTALATGAGSGRDADLYPVRITKTNHYSDIIAASSALTELDLYALSATDRRKYLSQSPDERTLSGKDFLVGSVGLWSVGMTTDASEIILKGYVGSINNTYVLVNGERVTIGQEFQAPTNASDWGAICLRFADGNPVRDIEIFGSWGWRSIEYNSDATVFNSYTRAIPGKPTVGIFGDSWIDGTARARPSVKVRLGTDPRWNLIESAKGGTGFTASSGQGGPYTDAERLGAMAALDAEYLPDIGVLWGTTNDSAASGAAVATAAETVIDTLLAVKPSMEFLITCSQASGAVHDEQKSALEALAATYDAGVVTVSDFMESFPTYAMKNTAPSDNHPSHDAVRVITEWLVEQIVSIIGPVY